MEKTRRHRVLAVLLVVLSVLPDLGSCNGVEQGMYVMSVCLCLCFPSSCFVV